MIRVVTVGLMLAVTLGIAACQPTVSSSSGGSGGSTSGSSGGGYTGCYETLKGQGEGGSGPGAWDCEKNAQWVLLNHKP